LDEVCDLFEAAWRRGEQPQIEEYLRQAPVARQNGLLRHLLILDMEYRIHRGDRVPVDEYKRRFTEHVDLIDRVLREAHQISGDASQSGFEAIHDDLPEVRPETIGRFRIVGLLGKGGFGSVYQGYDPELDRAVAIKCPHAKHLTPGEQERFLREGRSAAALKHPGIVPVYEIGQEDGVPYIVTELIDGSTLDQWRRTTQPTFRETAELAARIADALEYAHRQKVIHRDVKPGNILIDDSGCPHLTDFGLARRDGADVTLTLEGQILGTPAYMSPEQACGSNDAMDARVDVYSLGVVLYEMLTDGLPFRGNAGTLLHQAVHARPRPLRQANKGIPRDLERIVLKCLAKEPSRRYATAAELAEDLREWLRRQQTPPTPRRRAHGRGRWRRNVLALAALAAAVSTLILFLPMTPLFPWGTTRGGELSRPSSGPIGPDGLLDAAGPPAVEKLQDASRATPEPSGHATGAESGPEVQLIDDFEGADKPWEAFVDGAEETRVSFERDQTIRHGGAAALAVRYQVGPENWAACSLVYDQPQDWSDWEGLTLYLHAERAGQPVTIVAYGGESRHDLMHFEYHLQTSQSAVKGWQPVDIPWHKLLQPHWQGEGKARFDPRASRGIAFAFDGPESGIDAGRFWVDDVALVAAASVPANDNARMACRPE
jgi:serine/threonine protein kinase